MVQGEIIPWKGRGAPQTLFLLRIWFARGHFGSVLCLVGSRFGTTFLCITTVFFALSNERPYADDVSARGSPACGPARDSGMT